MLDIFWSASLVKAYLKVCRASRWIFMNYSCWAHTSKNFGAKAGKLFSDVKAKLKADLQVLLQ